MGKFVIRKTNTGIKFDLKATNGEVIATSEVYKAKGSVLKGIQSVQKNCMADIEDQTVENYAMLKNPKYEIYIDKAGEYRFRLKARNGEIITSSEGYKKMDSCLNGIDSVRRNAPDAEIIEEEA